MSDRLSNGHRNPGCRGHGENGLGEVGNTKKVESVSRHDGGKRSAGQTENTLERSGERSGSHGER